MSRDEAPKLGGTVLRDGAAMPEHDGLDIERCQSALADPSFRLVLEGDRVAHAEDVDERVPAEQEASASPNQRDEATGASVRHLPPDSPDFNPIGQAFSKRKALLRKAAASTIPDMWAAIAEATPLSSRREYTNYFQVAGYEPVSAETAPGQT